jgi:lipopolysaccharide biosynthesis protein
MDGWMQRIFGQKNFGPVIPILDTFSPMIDGWMDAKKIWANKAFGPFPHSHFGHFQSYD